MKINIFFLALFYLKNFLNKELLQKMLFRQRKSNKKSWFYAIEDKNIENYLNSGLIYQSFNSSNDPNLNLKAAAPLEI